MVWAQIHAHLAPWLLILESLFWLLLDLIAELLR
jgi:hypothetical protein